ncbi:hypothetical protein HZB02_06210 [Candidatus Woesearchaeota archaeon]|nr:hypothetical protein [Candidatus Woesearchaeota archaeon]
MSKKQAAKGLKNQGFPYAGIVLIVGAVFVILLLIVLYPVAIKYGTFDRIFPSNTPPIKLTTSAQLHEGLNFFQLDETKGIIAGAYNNNGQVVYFVTERGGPNAWIYFFDSNTPPNSANTCFTTSDGEPFIIGNHCPTLNSTLLPRLWSLDEMNTYRTAHGFTVQEEQYRTQDFKITLLIADALENMSLPAGLQWEKRSLITEARSQLIE